MSDDGNPLRFDGRVLYLTADPELVRRQLRGEEIDWDPSIPLMDNISTDEITPAWACFYYDRTLARHVFTGMRDRCVSIDEVARGGFSVVVSGLSKGCGSSRETAPYAEKWAGIRLVIARSIEKIYGQNCQNIGLYTSTDFSLVDRIRRGDEIPLSEFTKGLDPIGRAVVECGGLFAYNRMRLEGKATPPPLVTPRRAMTLVEKIIARKTISSATNGKLGVDGVKPGDALFVRTDVRFSHEYVTPMAESLLKANLGEDARVRDPESIFAFRDHLTFIGRIMTEEHRAKGLLEAANGLARSQKTFAGRQGIRLYNEVEGGGSEAICHNAVLEDIGLPGQVIVGSDSHTCTGGALGCFAFGIGSTDVASCWYTRDVRVRVPETVLFRVAGAPKADVCAKDIMLYIMRSDFIRSGGAIGKVLEFAGEGVMRLSLEERATLTNMAVEAGAFTGIIEPDDEVAIYIHRMRGIPVEDVRAHFVNADPGAEYFRVFDVDVSGIRPLVATPGDPRNGVFIEDLGKEVRVDIAYGGSCTGGKMTDMDMYATVFAAADRRGLEVHPDVRCYIQFGSQKIKEYARGKGYIDLFARVGAELLDPSCGACIKAGPGSSVREDEVTISAQNRNFPGRSGPGKVYLASPYVVAASALAGRIVEPSEYLEG